MGRFLTNFDDTEQSVAVEPEYSSTGEFWGADACAKPLPQPRQPESSDKRLNDSVDPDGD